MQRLENCMSQEEVWTTSEGKHKTEQKKSGHTKTRELRMRGQTKMICYGMSHNGGNARIGGSIISQVRSRKTKKISW
jgi:ribosomal protein L25 (general stress protein Ctc)